MSDFAQAINADIIIPRTEMIEKISYFYSICSFV